MKHRHAQADRGNDSYPTCQEAVHALLRAERLPRVIWECAYGSGAIVRVLRGAGHIVIGSDIADYRSPDQDHAGEDFLLARKVPAGAKAIVTNPPYRLASEFVEHALTLCPRVIMLLRLSFLESVRRTKILESGHLARVHIFRNRLPAMHRDGWNGPKVSTSIAYGWFCWDAAHRGPTTLHRISWIPKCPA